MVERGKQLFHTADTGCASCHESGAFADGQKHDIGSRNPTDLASDFETPSLRFIRGTAPYFHDGRFPTLEAMFEGTDGSMGHTMHLAREDRQALAAYLETL